MYHSPPRTHPHRYNFFDSNRLGFAYWVWVFLGVAQASLMQEMTLLDAFLFTLTCLAKCGVINPRDYDPTLWFMSAYILIGVPLHGLYWASVTDRAVLYFLLQYDDEEDEPHPAPAHKCYGVAQRVKRKRYHQLYQIFSTALHRETEQLDHEEKKVIKMRLSGVFVGGVELTVGELLFLIWGLASFAFIAFSTFFFCFLDPRIDVVLSFFFVINVGLGVGYTK